MGAAQVLGADARRETVLDIIGVIDHFFFAVARRYCYDGSENFFPVCAASRSASAKMMFGFLPPSSSETFLNNGAHASATLRPVTVPPVNEMVLIFGWAVIAEPTFGPVPWTTLSTPFGRPASRAISHSM